MRYDLEAMVFTSTKLWQSTSRCRLILLFTVFAVAVLFIHVQDFVAISRFQHYGIALLIFGFGCLSETIVSRKKLNRWARMSYLSTCIFFLSVGCVYLNNPWLGHRVSIATEDNQRTEQILGVSYLIFSIYLAAVWTKWILEEQKPRTNPGTETTR